MRLGRVNLGTGSFQFGDVSLGTGSIRIQEAAIVSLHLHRRAQRSPALNGCEPAEHLLGPPPSLTVCGLREGPIWGCKQSLSSRTIHTAM